MHPYLTEQLAREHRRELLRRARAGRLPTETSRARPRRPAGPARQRAGWALIELGLRLVGSPSH